MTLRALSLLALSSSLVAQIYSNGPLQTGVDGAGNAISVLETAAPPAGPGHTVFGYGAQNAAGNNLADDFTVCGGPWVVNEIEVFGYLTGAAAVSATDLRLEIYSGGIPGAGGVPLVDVSGNSLPGLAVNLTTLPAAVGTTVGVTAYANTFTNIYRTVPTPIGLTRNIQSLKVTLSPPLIIANGTYWLRFGYVGVSFCPPLTTPTMAVTGNGAQSTTAVPAFTTIVSGPAATPWAQGLPFRFYGTSAGPVGSITNLGGSCSTATLTVGGSPAAGGYVSATLTGLNPLYIAAITTDTTNPAPGTPGFIFGCAACTLWFTSTFTLWIQPSLQFQLPMSASLCGADVWIQGAGVDLFSATAACTIVPGIRAEFTDGYRVHLY
ncbi:MAG: hypothetical protein ABIP94_08025 [Planctomycetota bacterium]